MRALVQRVTNASITIDHELFSQIEHGLLIFVAIHDEDDDEDIQYIIKKTAHLRIFSDENDKMNKSVIDVNGSILLVSQFTLYANVNKGYRPSFLNAANPAYAQLTMHKLKTCYEKTGLKVETGKFAANMQVQLLNNGPVTIWIDSKDKS